MLLVDIYRIVTLPLPHYFSKMKVASNFLYYYARSLLNSEGGNKSISLGFGDLNSGVWRSFSYIISMYVKYLSPRFLFDALIIKAVATGWSSKKLVEFRKKNFTESNIQDIPKQIVINAEAIAKSMANEFNGVDYETLRRFILTYPYGMNSIYNRTDLANILGDTLVVELGAGIGTNAALHASLSKKGVYTFDIPAMNSVREIVTGKISKSVALSEITYFSDPKKLTESTKDKPYIVISYWAFTEFPLELRSQFEDLLTGAKFCFIISNPEFEGVNNFEYFESLKNRLGMQTLLFGDIHWQKLKNHRYVLLSSNQL